MKFKNLMASYCKVTLVGNVGKDPETKALQSGSVCEFSIAINQPARGQDPEKTIWYKIAAWNKTGEIAQKYITKGSQVMVEGRLSQRSYTAADGTEKTSLEVTASELVLLGSRNDAAPSQGASLPPRQAPAAAQNPLDFNAFGAPNTVPGGAPIGDQEDSLPF